MDIAKLVADAVERARIHGASGQCKHSPRVMCTTALTEYLTEALAPKKPEPQTTEPQA